MGTLTLYRTSEAVGFADKGDLVPFLYCSGQCDTEQVRLRDVMTQTSTYIILTTATDQSGAVCLQCVTVA